ncbi:4-hydroxy-tetrahydrodipicolinate synthase [Albibacterium profundi]|uniref:4-hydroxy-tetrahydrodipicolinate synthase n=1 Tax=Albibacterium profundi TaxID=3134906 RepID=A0ABV5CHQ0_9SPHI
MNTLIGVGVALVTPFDENNKVDFDTLGRLIEFQIEGAVDYLVILGTTGETATLSMNEKKEIFSYVAKKVNGRIPLVAGIGGNNTGELLNSINEIDLSPYAAILSVSPYYNKPTQEGIYLHYAAIAEATNTPIIIYNVPGRTGSNVNAKTIVRLANDFDNIVGVKDASGDFEQYNMIMREKPAGFHLISGDDANFLPMVSLGAVGLISVAGNAFPKEIKQLTDFALENRWSEARVIHFALSPLFELCFTESNPAGIKAILNQIGKCSERTRLPLIPVTEPTRQQIKQEVEQLKNKKGQS